jgi:hypothetical protein
VSQCGRNVGAMWAQCGVGVGGGDGVDGGVDGGEMVGWRCQNIGDGVDALHSTIHQCLGSSHSPQRTVRLRSVPEDRLVAVDGPSGSAKTPGRGREQWRTPSSRKSLVPKSVSQSDILCDAITMTS